MHETKFGVSLDNQNVATEEELQLIADLAKPWVNTSISALPLEKYIARSALQKCIRRGLTETAQRCALTLFLQDPAYCWRTLSIIAVEDIGMCNWTALTLARLAVSGVLAKSGVKPADFLKGLVHDLCTSAKSRALCEISVTVDVGGPKRYFDPAREQIANWEAEFWKPNAKLLPRYALSCLLGNKLPFETPGVGSNSARKLKFMEQVCVTELDCSVVRAVLLNFDKPLDTMHMAALPLALRLLQVPVGLDVSHDLDKSALPDIEGLPSATFDMHVQSGKLAIKATHTSLAKKHKAIAQIDPKKAMKALGAVIFTLEGGEVDCRAVGGWLPVLREAQDRALCSGYGLPMELYDEVREIMRANMDVLHQKRIWAQGMNG